MADGLTLNMAGVVAKWESHLRQFGARVRARGNDVVRTQMQDIRNVIIETSPVDTGALRSHWIPVTPRGDLVWGTGNDREYAPILEYGGYPGVGPRTIAAGPGPIGDEFTAGRGIYSKQAPLGWVRYALVRAKPQYLQRLSVMLKQEWER